MVPVLLLPGTLCTGAVFERQIAALEALTPTVEVVPFGRERSIDEMAATVEQRIPPGGAAAIAGFSMGGMVALALARRAPHKLARLALLNTNHHADFAGRRERRLAQLHATQADELADLIERDYLPHYLHRQQPEHRALILRMARELGAAAFRSQTAALAARPDASATLQSLRCPTLILGSVADPLCPPEVQWAMHRLSRGSDLLLLSDCGHFSTLERPDAVSAALCSWYLGETR